MCSLFNRGAKLINFYMRECVESFNPNELVCEVSIKVHTIPWIAQHVYFSTISITIFPDQ